MVGGSEIVDVDPTRFDVEYGLNASGSAVPALAAALERGDLDALFLPVVPGTDEAVRLFDDPLAVERTYVQETGIFPTMHTVVVRDAVIEEHPWVVQTLYDAFEEAKSIAFDSLAEPRWLPLAQSRLLVEEQEGVFGADPWEYGLTAQNVATLEMLFEYAHDQQVAAERYDPAAVFETDHLETNWFGAD